MRMFVAVELDDEARARVVREQQRALTLLGPTRSSSLRLIDPRLTHMTLAFLGEVDVPLADSVIAAMRAPIALAPFRIGIGGLGTFPPRGAPRVLWLGLVEGTREMQTLQSAVARRVEGCGVVLERRAFHPHLTIGRWRNARPSDRHSMEGTAFAAALVMAVERVTLFESRLSSNGASHFPLAHAPLTLQA